MNSPDHDAGADLFRMLTAWADGVAMMAALVLLLLLLHTWPR